MKKRVLKKTAAVLMAAVMLFSATGCGKGGSKQKEEKKDTKNMVYAGEELKIDGVEGDINTFFVKGDRLYFSTYEWIEGEGTGEKVKPLTESEEDETSKEATSEETTSEETTSEETTSEEITSEDATSEEETTGETEEDTGAEEGEGSEEITDEENMEGTSIDRYYSVNLEGTDLKEIKMPDLGEKEWMYGMIVNDDGTILSTSNKYDEKTETSTTYILKIDANGDLLFKEDLSKVIKSSSQEIYINKMMTDDKGRIILSISGMEASTGTDIYILDENAKMTGTVKSENYIDGMAKTKDGKIIAAYTAEKEGTVVQELDIESKQWGEKYKVDVAYLNGDSLIDGIAYDFYYRTDSGIFGYDLKEKKETQIIDFVASNMPSEQTWGMIPIAEDRMLGTYYEGEHSKLMIYSKVDPSTISDKQVITFGAMWVDDSVRKAAIEFNKQSNKYQIQFVEYKDAEDPEAKMSAEIAAGNIPDIIDMSFGPADMYAAKGLFEDLLPYIDKDTELSTDDFLPSILEAMKTEGKLYFISPGFEIQTLIGKSSDVGKEMGWTFEDMKALLEKKGDKVRPFYDNYKQNMIYAFEYTFNDFVNWETGECSFDSQDFKDILEICNRGIGGEPTYDENRKYVEAYRKGEVLFQQGWVTLDQIDVFRGLYDEKDITFIGYPNKDKEGSYCQFNTKMGISSKSDVKEGAWEFLRTFMTMKYQSTQGNLYDMPVRKDSFDMMVKAKMATKEYKDELGQTVTPIEGATGWDDVMIEMKPVKQADVDLFMKLIEGTHKRGSYNSQIMKIVEEEVKPYFAGEKDVNATADVIQSRIKTFVNENR